MSLLWTQGMSWMHIEGEPRLTPVPVRHAGFAGYVSHDKWGDLKDDTAPSMNPQEFHHIRVHKTPTDEYKAEHRRRFEKAKANATDEEIPDHADPRLFHFMKSRPEVDWTYAGLDLTHHPVHATQSHIAQEHLDRYRKNPDSAPNDEDASKIPLIVQHEGRLHAMDGHHRLAEGIHRGETDMPVWYFNLDQHYMPAYDNEDH